MKQVIFKVQFDDEGGYKGYGDNTEALIKAGLEQFLQIDLEDDDVIKKGWSCEMFNLSELLDKHLTDKKIIDESYSEGVDNNEGRKGFIHGANFVLDLIKEKCL